MEDRPTMAAFAYGSATAYIYEAFTPVLAPDSFLSPPRRRSQTIGRLSTKLKRNNYCTNVRHDFTIEFLNQTIRRFRLYCRPVLLYGFCLEDNELDILSSELN